MGRWRTNYIFFVSVASKFILRNFTSLRLCSLARDPFKNLLYVKRVMRYRENPQGRIPQYLASVANRETFCPRKKPKESAQEIPIFGFREA